MRGLGSRLLKLRLHLQYSREKMARTLGVIPNTVSRYENDDVVPGLAPLFRLQKECDVSMDWLLFNKGPMFFLEKEPEIEEPTPPAPEPRPEIKELMTYMEQDPVFLYETMLSFHRYCNKEERE